MEILAAAVIVGTMIVVKKAFSLAWRFWKKDYKRQIIKHGKEGKKGKGQEAEEGRSHNAG